ncbi:MAG: tRNA (guanosine(37)-N1)-methyltransferase TrmD [Patescibacteria group bacterium]
MNKIRFHILTLFPEMFESVFASSILSRAQKKGIMEIKYYNLRDFAADKHKTVDDTPYGGGPGMVLKIDVMDKAITSIKSEIRNPKSEKSKVILMTPQGKRFDQKKAAELSNLEDIILICGHYEGFDERIREHLVDEEISIGDFVLSGGEIPAMAVVDAVARLVPGVLGKDESSNEESFSLTDDDGKILLEYPIYTRPVEYKGWKVPEVLQNGNHAEIKKWRLEEAKNRTKDKRTDR